MRCTRCDVLTKGDDVRGTKDLQTENQHQLCYRCAWTAVEEGLERPMDDSLAVEHDVVLDDPVPPPGPEEEAAASASVDDAAADLDEPRRQAAEVRAAAERDAARLLEEAARDRGEAAALLDEARRQAADVRAAAERDSARLLEEAASARGESAALLDDARRQVSEMAAAAEGHAARLLEEAARDRGQAAALLAGKRTAVDHEREDERAAALLAEARRFATMASSRHPATSPVTGSGRAEGDDIGAPSRADDAPVPPSSSG
jgi:hypothetical protein